MLLEAGKETYRWIENWAKLPDMEGHVHHGLVINREGNIITGHATEARILILSPEGDLLNSFDVPLVETHGITIVEEEGEELLYIADVSEWQEADGKVIKVDMKGNVLAEIHKMDIPGYTDEEWFSTTTVAWDSSNGDIWITDGYGKQRVHRFNSKHEHILTIDGTEGSSGKFQTPHWIHLDFRRGDVPELYIADRRSDQIQVYSREGEWLRVIRADFSKPSVFAPWKDWLVVGELDARLVVLDADDQVVVTLGSGVEYCKKEGWPNRKKDGEKVPPHFDIEEGKFNSPHGVAVDEQGHIYISEWLLGDRFIKLERQGA